MDGIYRHLDLGGADYADTDWLDPGVTPPSGARALIVSDHTIVWQVVPVDADGNEVAADGMTVDARMVVFRGGRRSGGASVVESSGSEQLVSVDLVDTEMVPGETVRPMLISITNPGAVAGCNIYIVSGAVLP